MTSLEEVFTFLVFLASTQNVKSYPELTTLPVSGTTLTEPVIGTSLTEPVIGTTLTEPVIGTTLTKAAIGTTLTEPVLGTTLTEPVIGPTLTDCNHECTFAISRSTLTTVMSQIQNLISSGTNLLIYVHIDQLNFKIRAEDKKMLNQFLEWIWTLEKNLWYVRLPADLDYGSFHITEYGEEAINIPIESLSSSCCLNEKTILSVRDLIWSQVFQNVSNSFLCNRNFDSQEWKVFLYYVTTVWLGYDLRCSSSKTEQIVDKKVAGSIMIPTFCFFIALFHPMLFRLISSSHRKRRLSKIKNYVKHGMNITDYLEGDSPFGPERIILKLCFTNELRSPFQPLYHLSILLSLVYLFFSGVPMTLEYIYNNDQLVKFPEAYKIGLPVLYAFKSVMYTSISDEIRIVAAFGVVPIIIVVNIWIYKQFSVSRDFIIVFGIGYGRTLQEIFRFEFVDDLVRMNDITILKGCDDISLTSFDSTDQTESKEIVSSSENIEHTYNEIKHIPSISKSGSFVYTLPKDRKQTILEDFNDARKRKESMLYETLLQYENLEFSVKFIKRFKLLLSSRFWKHIFAVSMCSYKHDKSSKLITLIKFIPGVLLMLINGTFAVLTCAFPAIWLVIFTVINNTRALFKSWRRENSWKSTLRSVVFVLLALFGVLVQYLQLSIVVFIVKSVMYVLFVALTNYQHLTRILVVITTCVFYFGRFMVRFIDRYKLILDIMFQVKQKFLLDKREEDATSSTEINEKMLNANTTTTYINTNLMNEHFISEPNFDYVVGHCYVVGEKAFFIIVKTIVTVMFFTVCLFMLSASNVFDTTTSANFHLFLQLSFVIIMPSVFLNYFERNAATVVEDHRDEVKHFMLKYLHVESELKVKQETVDSNIYSCCLAAFYRIVCCDDNFKKIVDEEIDDESMTSGENSNEDYLPHGLSGRSDEKLHSHADSSTNDSRASINSGDDEFDSAKKRNCKTTIIAFLKRFKRNKSSTTHSYQHVVES